MAATLGGSRFLLQSPFGTRKDGVWRPINVANPCRCEAVGNEGAQATASERRTTVKSRDDSLVICRIVNGMWQTSGGWGRIDRNAAVDAMLRYADAGLTTFDMADIYGPAEDLYGTFLNRVRRERPPELLNEIKGWDYSNPGYLDALKHLTDLKEEGKIKTIALTNFDTERLQIILENGIPVVSNQVQHSVVDMRPQQRMAELCQLTGVKLITSLFLSLMYGTVMGGLLSEKFLNTNMLFPLAAPPLNTPSLQKYKMMVDAWGGWNLFQDLLQTLKKVASKHRVTVPAVAVRYILDQPSVAGSMIGVRLGLSQHIEDSLAIFSLELDEEDNGNINSVSRKGRDLLKVIGDCGDEYRRA
ncbi:flagellar radial spoke protein 5-like isoform X3 [Nymphaea colorata]|uniref:flagellar radial spoke protein 5-like isoform X3 n=1 Tax=Nymphaea colorata TaxID=210225 RepID=UPI00129DDC0F|nr:flagellar radial spoke protein 5-like isoform X3 [Nymphaea colorata]